jgi:hypothetical protein
MAITVDNPRSGRLVIAEVHDGACGIGAAGPDGAVMVAFHWDRRGARPEAAAGRAATLDGAPYLLRGAARSAVSQGFYLARLEPAS